MDTQQQAAGSRLNEPSITRRVMTACQRLEQRHLDALEAARAVVEAIQPFAPTIIKLVRQHSEGGQAAAADLADVLAEWDAAKAAWREAGEELVQLQRAVTA